jgi:hypothetical protein
VNLDNHIKKRNNLNRPEILPFHTSLFPLYTQLGEISYLYRFIPSFHLEIISDPNGLPRPYFGRVILNNILGDHLSLLTFFDI